MRIRCSIYLQKIFTVCSAVLLITNAEYAAATEVSLCDYWPHHVGNVWSAAYAGVPGYYIYSVDDVFFVNGCQVWKTMSGSGDLAGPEVSYTAFVDGWLCITNHAEDLDQLPAITGNLKQFLPLTIVVDEPFFSPYWNGMVTFRGGSLFSFYPNGLPAPGTGVRLQFPLGDQPDVLVLTSGSGLPPFFWNRWMCLAKGLGIMCDFTFPMNEIRVLGGCDSSLAITRPPVGGRHEEGSRLELSVEVAGKSGGLLYQWIRNGIYATGQTGSVYTIEALGFGDAGRYSCIVSNPGKGSVQTLPVEIRVVEAGTLPAAGLSGLATLALAIGGLVAFRRAR